MTFHYGELPVELILYTVSFLTREIILDPRMRLPVSRLPRRPPRKPALVPDLPSINAITRTNRVFYHTLNQTLYILCASVESLGRLALLFAVEHNLGGAFDKLVAAGIRVDGPFGFKRSRCSLLHIAAGMGHQLIVSKLLVMYGEEMLARVYAHDSNNRTALDHAVLEGHTEIIRLLARPSVPGELIQLETHKQYISRALLATPREANIAVYEYLISQGADPDIRDTDPFYWTLLSYATVSNDLALMQLLLDAGADPDGSLPLFRVASIPAAEALLAAGANIHATDSKARNVLGYRLVETQTQTPTELLSFFLERGVNPNHKDDAGETPLHHACKTAGKASIELLLQFGATTVEKADRNGTTPVHLAMQTGKVEVVRLFEPLVQNPSLKLKIARWLRRNPEEERSID
ncbi:Ankyrin repeat protein [Mycena sanguinolenta]|uniref:Ankyrin repeat protein n=1 Tax=Mycena sanguinolenta TaxID=230812 RepID=A0A8H6ZEX3_9AGAR|nr:Ankyrin repeat protein [Mycena sanguinolenta]